MSERGGWYILFTSMEQNDEASYKEHDYDESDWIARVLANWSQIQNQGFESLGT